MATPHKPNLIIMAGPNGSGKTSITTQVLEDSWAQDCVYINPDNIARDDFGNWNGEQEALKAAQKAEEIRENCLTTGKSLIFETVFSAPDKLEYLERAKKAGFFIRLFFVATNDPTINIQRIAQRVKEGGHSVPEDKIISRYYKSIAQCAIAIKLADRAYIYDNSIDRKDARLLFRTSNGDLEKQYAGISEWASEIFAEAIQTTPY